MYLCLCHGVSQKKVKALVTGGAQSLRQVQKACQAGTDCGSCLKDLRRYIGDLSSPPKCKKSCSHCSIKPPS